MTIVGYDVGATVTGQLGRVFPGEGSICLWTQKAFGRLAAGLRFHRHRPRPNRLSSIPVGAEGLSADEASWGYDCEPRDPYQFVGVFS